MSDELVVQKTIEEPGLIDDLAPASPPIEISMWWYAGPVLLILLIVGIIWSYRKRIRTKLAEMTQPRPHDPACLARDALVNLREEMHELTMREFIDRLSIIFRTYLEGRFKMRATSQTTQEFLLHATKFNPLDSRDREEIREFLEACDRSKFAHQSLSEQAGMALLGYVESFISKTEKASEQEGVK